MLVLGRRQEEGITLVYQGVHIKVQVMEVRRGGMVRLGIVAPEGVAIYRDEVLDQYLPIHSPQAPKQEAQDGETPCSPIST